MQLQIIFWFVVAAVLLSIALTIEDWFTRRSCEQFWESAKRRRESEYRDRLKRKALCL